ncbi:MAG: TatD family hydrolase [Steroidobacteraceae bacterium]
MSALFDIGLNLTHESFAADLDAVLARAAAAGVTQMLITGSDVPHSQAALQLAQRYPDHLRATAGVHPHHAKDFTAATIPALRELLTHPLALAVGECGLDYFRNFSTHEQQEQALRAQLELAVAVGKPVFLHERDAHDAFVGIVNEYLPRLNGGVAHCFTGTPEQVRRYLDMGLHVGVTGWICDERRGASS